MVPLFQILFSIAALLIVIFVTPAFSFLWILVTIAFIFIEEKKGYKIHRYVKDNYPDIYKKYRSHNRQNSKKEFILKIYSLTSADINELDSNEIKSLIYEYRHFIKAMVVSFILFISSGLLCALLHIN
jgi:hypothetical protein